MTGPKRILIVEDRPEIRRLMQMALHGHDYVTAEAADGRAGLAMIDSFCPDLVLLDIMMPGELDGLAVCRAIKSRPEGNSPRVVLVSALAQDTDLEAGKLAGADAYLQKPFSVADLLQKLRDLLSSSH